jgi:hypothetical protein
MKVAVKKSVLFSILKKHLNENRSNNDMGGRLIHPFNIQSSNSDPFGFYEEDAPIKPSSHMATQLSIEEPPVDDEEYVPGTISELCAASSVICREVPHRQIEYFYRRLHEILDEAIEKEEAPDELFEGFSISKKTKIVDFDIISESTHGQPKARIRKKRTSASRSLESIPAELGAEDLPGYEEASDKDEYMRGYNFAADFEIGGKSEDELEEHDSYVTSQSQDFQSGYLAGSDVSTGIQPIDRESLRPMFPKEPGVAEDPAMRGEGMPLYRSYQQYLTRTGIEEVMGKSYEELEPFEQAVYDAHDELQLFFKQIDAEFTNELMNPDLKKEFGALLKPLTHEFGITPNTVLNPIKVKSMFAAVNNIKDPAKRDQKIQELLMVVYQRIFGILSRLVETKSNINKMMTGFANQVGDPINIFVQKVSEAIAADYANYGLSTRFDSADAIIDNVLTKAFSKWVKTVPMSEDGDSKFLNQTHFIGNVDLSAEEDFKAMFFEFVESKFKKAADEFEFRDADTTVLVTAEEAREASDGKVAGAFAMAREEQEVNPPDLSQSASPTPVAELTEEEKYVKKIERYAELIAQGKQFDWRDLFPYFGFSGEAGIRQWYLKKIQPKVDLFTYKYQDPDTGEVMQGSINELYNQNMELIIKQLALAIKNVVIPDLENRAAKNKLKPRSYDEKKHKLKQVDEAKLLHRIKNEILPEIEAIVEFMDQYDIDYQVLAEETEFLQTVGGAIIRNVGSYPLDNLIAEFSTQWSEEIKGIINQIRKKHNPDVKSDLTASELNSVVEYFTGLKGDPDFSNKNKAAKNLINAGITPEAYVEIAVEARNTWIDLESQLDGTLEGAELNEFFIDEVDKLVENEKEMAKMFMKGYKDFMQFAADSRRMRQVGI